MNYTSWIQQLCLSCLACIILDRSVLAGTAVYRPQARDIHGTNRAKGMVASPRVQLRSKSASMAGNPGRRLLDRKQVRLNAPRSPARAGLQRIMLVTKAGATITAVPGEPMSALHRTSIPPPYAGGSSIATTRAVRTSSTLTSTKTPNTASTATVTPATASPSTSATSTSPSTTSTTSSTTSTATPTTTSSLTTSTTSSTATTTATPITSISTFTTSSTSTSTTTGTTVSTTTKTTTTPKPPLCYPSQGEAPSGSPCVNPTYDVTKCCAAGFYCYEGTYYKFPAT